MGEWGAWGAEPGAWALPPSCLPPTQGPPPSDKAVALPLPAWQAAWASPFSKEAHFLPPRAGLDEPGAPHRCRSYPSLHPHPQARTAATAAIRRSPAPPPRSPFGQRPPARPCAPVPTSPDPSAATSEGWSRDAVAPAACSPWVPVRAHAGPQARPQPCPWTPDKAQRTEPLVDSMDRRTLPPVVALLLAVCSLRPTSRCPGTLGWGGGGGGGEIRPQVSPASNLVLTLCPVGLS